MIVNKVQRKMTAHPKSRGEFAYMTRLSRYVVRADAHDLHKLALQSDSTYLTDLARYAVGEGRGEKAIAFGAMNLLGDGLEEWQAELTALLHRCPNATGAIDHWVLSCQVGDNPTIEEMERAIGIFMRCQEIEDCPTIWAFHGDTDNPHVHLAIVRIDPKAGIRITAGDGWDIDTGHRAKAVIEAEFPHWAREAGSRYEVRDGQLLERATGRAIGEANDPSTWSRGRHGKSETKDKPVADSKAISVASLAYEEATGFMSRERIAMEIAVPIILASKTLDDAHAALAKEGIALQRHRSGAAFVIDRKPVKASINRGTSLSAIEKRFKESLEASPYAVSIVDQRERWPGNPARRDYYAARRIHDALARAAVGDVRTALGGRTRDATVASAVDAAIAASTFPAFEAWLAGASAPDPAAALQAALGFSTLSVDARRTAPLPGGYVHGFWGRKLGDRTVFRAHGQGGPAAFVDIGDKVLVYASDNRAAVRASLLLMAERYPDNTIAVTGDRKFQRLVLEIANQEGFRLDGALGRQQVRQLADRASPSDAFRQMHIERNAESASAIPQAIQKPTVARRRLLAMMSRVFHEQSWHLDDYRPATRVRAAVAAEPPQVLLSPLGQPAKDAPIADPRQDHARRAAIAVAAAAASRSR